MPAASLYFHDPDGNLLEFLAMLDESPKPLMGIVNWSGWARQKGMPCAPGQHRRIALGCYPRPEQPDFNDLRHGKPYTSIQ
jgi:hypothetical protein